MFVLSNEIPPYKECCIRINDHTDIKMYAIIFYLDLNSSILNLHDVIMDISLYLSLIDKVFFSEIWKLNHPCIS